MLRRQREELQRINARMGEIDHGLKQKYEDYTLTPLYSYFAKERAALRRLVQPPILVIDDEKITPEEVAECRSHILALRDSLLHENGEFTPSVVSLTKTAIILYTIIGETQ